MNAMFSTLSGSTLNNLIHSKDHLRSFCCGDHCLLFYLETLIDAQLFHIADGSLIHIEAVAWLAVTKIVTDVLY